MQKPCNDCPFLRDGGILLTRERRREISKALRGGGMFPCHKTVDYGDNDEGKTTGRSHFCAGALLTMDNSGGAGCMANQMARIFARFGRFNPDKLEGHDLVFDSLAKWAKDAANG